MKLFALIFGNIIRRCANWFIISRSGKPAFYFFSRFWLFILVVHTSILSKYKYVFSDRHDISGRPVLLSMVMMTPTSLLNSVLCPSFLF